MAGIPLHTASPINTNASDNTGVTPATTQPADSTDRAGPAYVPARTTATISSYPPARPGAVPGPAPTGAPQPAGQHPAPTATARAQPANIPPPPPPQPGAVPSPFVTPPSPITHARRPSIPPPPKAGEVPMPAAYYSPHYEQEQQQQSPYPSQTRMPPQMSSVLSTPSRAIPPSGTTSTPAYADLSHPPGYIQNSGDSFDDRSNTQPQYQNQNYGNNSLHRGGLLDSNRPVGDELESPLAQAWKTASSWAKTAGDKLKEGEEEVWRRINSEK